MADERKTTPSENKNISINGDVVDSVVVVGDNNTTFFQKVINIFKSDSETLEHRNRRILLNHVENAWIKGVLDASLHGAALLDLGIKQDPEAVTKYPWAIKKESTDETLPAGASMLEIFDNIGMGRSLLILGAPGSGKTTMLLELTRQLIARAREDVTQPIPMVFNLASWTERLSLADWLTQELNNIYSVPKKTAPDWIKGNKLLLLLDGLDEVRQESRAKCVGAINTFRKEHGLTSLAVCSRSQDYADLNTKLSFEGAIEVQPLTQKQIIEFFNHFGKEMTGIKQVLKKDIALREMAETPLFLSIMIMAYRDKQDVDILTSQDRSAQRTHLFDKYIERMLERSRSKKTGFKTLDVLNGLSWLAQKMIEHNVVPYVFENMQPSWLGQEERIRRYRRICGQIFGLMIGLGFALSAVASDRDNVGLIGAIFMGSFFWLTVRLFVGVFFEPSSNMSVAMLPSEILHFLKIRLSLIDEISLIDSLSFNWQNVRQSLPRWVLTIGLISIISGPIFGMMRDYDRLRLGLRTGLFMGLMLGLIMLFIALLIGGVGIQQVDKTTYPGQRLVFTRNNFLLIALYLCLIFGLVSGLRGGLLHGLISGLLFGLIGGSFYGGFAIIQHYVLRDRLAHYNLLPWRLVPFLDHCVDLIFLRRVGGGYIFIHRLLMEHFAEMNFNGLPEIIHTDGAIDKMIDFAQSQK